MLNIFLYHPPLKFLSSYRVHTGKFESNSRPFQGLLETILQFSRIKIYEKILILVLKFYFRNAKLRYGRNWLKKNKLKLYAAPNKAQQFYTDLGLYQQS